MWAMFKKVDGTWKFCGMTPHEEYTTEFEETVSEDEDVEATKVVYLEDD